ncbi:MAG: hypothetical protein NC429_10835 [Lachnospiraceae bacterium]|nr:hypothetical protein [Lachnospiraceae bacterium]
MKKFIKSILYILGILFVLFGALVIVCAFRPDVTERIADFLYPERNRIEAENAKEPGGDNFPEAVQAADTVEGAKEEDAETPPLGAWEEAEDSALEKEGIDPGIISEYTPPEETDIIVPENVAGKTGYQQIQEDNRQVEEEEARQIQDQLGIGNAGDGLIFDSRFYPYYAMLDEKGRHLYRQIYANAEQLYPVFAPVEPVAAGQLKNVFAAVYNDHPELFWMETAYACKCRSNGQCVEIDLRFNRTAQDLDNAKALFADNGNQILALAQGAVSGYEKEKLVHDALLDRVSYNLRAEMNQSAYSALVNGQTVCAGYARAFQYLLQQLGIPCYYCTGYAGENHAWNIVELSDGYYNVDATWDDTGEGSYDYFNKTDADYADTHVRKELAVYLPPCNGQSFRNLEPDEEKGKRSLEEAGFSEEQVLYNLPDYHEDCYNQVVSKGLGSYAFYSVIEGEELLEAWYEDYRLENYRKEYMEEAMTQIGASSCEIRLSVEELKGGRYLITHEAVLR